MGAFIQGIIAFFMIAPIFLFLVVFVASYFINGQSKMSLQLAADVSTFFLIPSVYFIILTLWNQSFFWLIFTLLLLFLGGFTYLYWNLKGDINYKKILKGYWRFNFLLFSLLYFLFMSIGIFSSAFTFLAK